MCDATFIIVKIPYGTNINITKITKKIITDEFSNCKIVYEKSLTAIQTKNKAQLKVHALPLRDRVRGKYMICWSKSVKSLKKKITSGFSNCHIVSLYIF